MATKDFESKVKAAKAKIAESQKAAKAASNAKELKDITDKAKAIAKVKRSYADSLSNTLDAFNETIDQYATKVARGDKLTVIEQRELDNAINQANSLTKTIDAAIKEAYDIESQGQRDYAEAARKQRQKGEVDTTQLTTTPSGVSVSTESLPSGFKPASTTTQGEKISNKPSTPAKGTMPELPTGGPAGVAGAGFNPAQVRAGEEASMGTAKPAGTAAPSDLQTLLKKTEFWYDLPDYIFETVPGLGDILVKAVNEGWDDKKFLSAAQQTKWWQANSGVFRERLINKAKYNELRTQGADVTKTDYGQYLAKQMRNVKAQAKTLAGVTLDDAQAQQIAEKIYDGNLDDDPLAINRLIVPFIGKVTDRYGKTDVTTYGGKALQGYQTLQAIAKANGLSLNDILPQISTATTGGDLEKAVLQGIAAGDIDINRVAQNARMVAAQGQPEYVRNLLNQGYDLEQVYAPYKNVMAKVLELNPDQIDLNDTTLRSAINNNGDMNVYDFKKALRADTRWQYTENARDEMTNTALTLLRNFGFQG